MPQKELSDLVEELKICDKFKNWELQIKLEGMYKFLRKRENVYEARIYMEIEDNKFGWAYIVVDISNKDKTLDNEKVRTVDNGKGHCPESTKFKEIILEIVNRLNNTYFTQTADQGHNAPTQQSSS